MRIAMFAALCVFAPVLATTAAADVPVTLRGSPESMIRQHRVALESSFSFYRTPAQVRAAAAAGDLVALEGSESYELGRMSFPFARPEVQLFVERFSAEFHASCGERLVVTSLTRAQTRQPRNAHPLSVHPAGMAMDLRVPRRASCRIWLESTLLEMEGAGLLDATRERNPAHYHVALFPESYLAHLERMQVDEAAERMRLDNGILPASLEPHAVAPSTGPAFAVAPAVERSGGRSVMDRILALRARLFGALRLS